MITSLTYKDDEVLKQSTIATIKYDDLGIDKDEAKQMFKMMNKHSKDRRGYI